MPPRRRAPASSQPEPKKKRSAVAKEHGISAEQESEIAEAYSLFAVEAPGYEDEAQGVLKVDDVRRCLIALGITPSTKELPEIIETIDPTSSGVANYPTFVAVAAALLNSRSDSPDAQNEEIQTAFNLFTKNGGDVITLAHLKRIAKELREEVSDEVLKDMILEANGGVGREGISRGVGVEDFEGVMKRAGVFG